jgi:hypothetical protein
MPGELSPESNYAVACGLEQFYLFFQMTPCFLYIYQLGTAVQLIAVYNFKHTVESLQSHHVSLVQWTSRLLPITRDPSSNLLGGTCVKLGFSS